MTTRTTRRQAYAALNKAATKMGAKNFRMQLAAHKKKGRKASTCRYVVTSAHKRVVSAMPKVLSGKMSVEEAFAILHEHDVLEQRL